MSALLPLWKIKREWKRFLMQFGQLEWLIFGRKRKRDYDRSRASLVKVTEGAVALTPKLAILLIWQPNGLLPSFLEELRHFLRQGYAPVVVSNAPLGLDDLAQLQPLCHLIVQRPNYGYDFGGYREGVLVLRERGIQPEHLVIKNDSIWFPLWEDCDLIARAEASPADLYGIYENEMSRRPHLQSYFYHFGAKILRDPDFWGFWDGLWLTDNKYMVIRQCEMKLTQVFRRKGYLAESRFTTQDMRTALSGLKDADLAAVLKYQVKVDTRSAPVVLKLVGRPADAGWRKNVVDLISRGLIGKYFLITHPAALYGVMACPVLKKDRQPMYRLQRKELLRMDLVNRIQPAVLQEIKGMDEDRPHATGA